MSEYGLYLPKIFRRQEYLNPYNLPMTYLEDRTIFIEQSVFEELRASNHRLFNKITMEFILRGGKFIVDSDSFYYLENNLSNRKVITVYPMMPIDAFKNINLKPFNLDYIINELDIYDNWFFHNIPLDGFKVFGLEDDEIIHLEKALLEAGFRTDVVKQHLFTLPDSLIIEEDDSEAVSIIESGPIEGYGLYLPRIFISQKYLNTQNLPLQSLENEITFVDQEIFDKMRTYNKFQYDKATIEFVLRGGQFILKSESFDYSEIKLVSGKVILVSADMSEDAYRYLGLKDLHLDCIYNAFEINSNWFFHNIPLEGFRVLGLKDDEITVLEKNLLKAGFHIKEEKLSMFSLPGKSEYRGIQ